VLFRSQQEQVNKEQQDLNREQREALQEQQEINRELMQELAVLKAEIKRLRESGTDGRLARLAN
jgi:hypothetical protein